MKYYDLDPEEKDILEAFDRGEFRPVKNQEKLKKYYQEVARYTLAKMKNINIRLPAKVLFKLKSRAAEEGIPYQTLVASIIHKYTQGTL